MNQIGGDRTTGVMDMVPTAQCNTPPAETATQQNLQSFSSNSGVPASAPVAQDTYPAQTTIDTPHGMVTVHSRWTGDHWEHQVPSYKSSVGNTWHVSALGCNCPSRRICWHLLASQRVETGLHALVWELLRRYVTYQASAEDYVWGMAQLAKLGLNKATAREVLEAPTLVVERVIGRAA